MKIPNSKFQIPNFKLKVLVFGLVFLIFPISVFGATLYLEPKEGEYQLGDHFGVKIRLGPEGECINTISVDLSFPNDILILEGIDFGESIITIWVDKPSSFDIKKLNETGKIHFSGGIPGGYCGRIQGDPGLTNMVAEFRFYIPSMIVGEAKEESGEIKILESSQVFLNDGKGTLTKLNFQNSKIKILPTVGGRLNEWREKLLKDTTPPEPFEIQIQRNLSIFNGKYFIVFYTTDKETGVDYYMIKEGERDWKVAKSPYLLENQNLDEEIKVKAVDIAGNETIATLYPEKIREKTKAIIPPKKEVNWKKIAQISAILILVFTLILIALILVREKFLVKKKENNPFS
jgi:hypothetical protein